jgi:putative ABC transport system permease protein
MRNKLFTFISLFGISLTLTILIVGASFYDYFTKSSYPTYKQERIFYTSMLESWKKPPGEKDNSYSSLTCSYYFLDKCLGNLEVPESVTFYNMLPRERTVFINSHKFEFLIKYCDENFWSILDFNFIAGRPFNKSENYNVEKVTVIVESLAKDIFGEAKLAIGKTIPIDEKAFKVVGVVKDVPMTNLVIYANSFCPITTSQENIFDKKLHGSYGAMLLAHKKSDFNAIETEINKSLKIFEQTEMPLDYRNYIDMDIGDSLTRFIHLTPVNETTFFTFLSTLIFIIILIPSLNLINLNVNRINERLAEIGIRKSFGARRVVLVWQFIIENIILTFLGGIMALVLTFATLIVLQSKGIIPSEGLLLNYRILFTGLVFCFLFGFIAGVLPAYRMSRLQIVESLKNGE